jgi:hypothetical protein
LAAADALAAAATACISRTGASAGARGGVLRSQLRRRDAAFAWALAALPPCAPAAALATLAAEAAAHALRARATAASAAAAVAAAARARVVVPAPSVDARLTASAIAIAELAAGIARSDAAQAVLAGLAEGAAPLRVTLVGLGAVRALKLGCPVVLCARFERD